MKNKWMNASIEIDVNNKRLKENLRFGCNQQNLWFA